MAAVLSPGSMARHKSLQRKKSSQEEVPKGSPTSASAFSAAVHPPATPAAAAASTREAASIGPGGASVASGVGDIPLHTYRAGGKARCFDCGHLYDLLRKSPFRNHWLVDMHLLDLYFFTSLHTAAALTFGIRRDDVIAAIARAASPEILLRPPAAAVAAALAAGVDLSDVPPTHPAFLTDPAAAAAAAVALAAETPGTALLADSAMRMLPTDAQYGDVITFFSNDWKDGDTFFVWTPPAAPAPSAPNGRAAVATGAASGAGGGGGGGGGGAAGSGAGGAAAAAVPTAVAVSGATAPAAHAQVAAAAAVRRRYLVLELRVVGSPWRVLPPHFVDAPLHYFSSCASAALDSDRVVRFFDAALLPAHHPLWKEINEEAEARRRSPPYTARGHVDASLRIDTAAFPNGYLLLMERERGPLEIAVRSACAYTPLYDRHLLADFHMRRGRAAQDVETALFACVPVLALVPVVRGVLRDLLVS